MVETESTAGAGTKAKIETKHKWIIVSQDIVIATVLLMGMTWVENQVIAFVANACTWSSLVLLFVMDSICKYFVLFIIFNYGEYFFRAHVLSPDK